MKNKYLAFILLALAFLVGCSHETDEFDGPNLIDRFGPFELIAPIEASVDSVDFSINERVFFTATFNKRTNWIVQITGMESGARKIITGLDNMLSNENAVWRGGTTELPLFREESCLVELIIPEADSLTMYDSVLVTGVREYDVTEFTGFEEDLGLNLSVGNFEFEFSPNTGRTNDGNAAQGDWYYFLEGTDNVVSNFFVGLIDINSTVTGSTYVPVPTTIPENLFFNMFLYHDGSPHGTAVIQFIFDSNDSGAFEDGQDATFQLDGDFPLGWIGWRQFSHSMADVGMTEEQVSKIVGIRALLISNMNTQPDPPLQVSYGLDYMVFTENGPLETE